MADPEDEKKSEVDETPSAPESRADSVAQVPEDKPWEGVYLPKQEPENGGYTPDDKPWDRDQYTADDKPWDNEAHVEDKPFERDERVFAGKQEEDSPAERPISNSKSTSPLQAAAARTPTDEATLHLQALLDTVGDAGLRATFSLPDPLPEPEPAPQTEPEPEARTEPKTDLDPDLQRESAAPEIADYEEEPASAPSSEPRESPSADAEDESSFQWNFKKGEQKKQKRSAIINEAATEPANPQPFNLKGNTRKTHRTKPHRALHRPYTPGEGESTSTDSSGASSLKNLAEALTGLNATAETAPSATKAMDSLTDLASALEAVGQDMFSDDTEYGDSAAPAEDLIANELALPETAKDAEDKAPPEVEAEDFRESEPIVEDEPIETIEPGAEQSEAPAASGDVYIPEPIEKPDLQLENIKDSRKEDEIRELIEKTESLESSTREVDLDFDLDEDDDTPYEPISFRAQKRNIALPEPHTAESLDELSVMLPGDPDDAYSPVALGEFARSTGMEQNELNFYFEIVFLKMANKRLRQEAKEGLRYEIMLGKNAGALKVLQEVSAIQAAVQLKDAEQENNAKKILESLCRLAFLEKGSKTAAEILQGSGKKERSVPHPLTDYARKAARYLRISKYEEAIRAFGIFLERNTDLDVESLQRQRKEALVTIEAAAVTMLNTLANDEYLLLSRKLKSIHAILVIAETDKPKLASEQLRNLREWKEIDKTAAGFLNHIEKQIEHQPGISRLKDIEKDLSLGNVQPLKLLKECVPDLEDELNRLRLEQIKQELTPESSSIEFEESSKKLDNELRHGNEAASQELKWTRTGQTVRRITEAIQNRNLNDIESVKLAAETIRLEMDRLCQLFYANNVFARHALLGMLFHTADARIVETWRLTQERATVSPDLSLLSPKELSIISEHVALVFNEAQKANPDGFKLRPAEARGLANVLAKFSSIRERSVQKALEAVFLTAFKSRSKSVAVDGLLSGKAYEIPDYATFTNLIKHATADGGLTNNQLKQLGSLAKQSVKAAISVLGGIARGALDSSQASSAAEQLLEAASLPDNRKSLLKVLVQEYEREGDRACLLSTMGEIAAKEIHIDAKVIETLRVAFESSSKSLYSALYKSAFKGFFAIAKNWQEREILTLSRNLRPDVLKSIAEVGHLLTRDCCDAFLELQHESLVKGKADDRLCAVQVVAALLRHASPGLVRDLVRDLKFYSSSRGEAELQRAGLPKDRLARFLEFARSALADVANLPQEKPAPKQQETLITPFEAREALDAAAAAIGDSLHSGSSGHEETRKTYERSIQSGLMTIADAKKLLKLPSEDRLIIESLLKDDDLSNETFSVLIKLNNEVISKLFSVPPRICSSVLLPALAATVLNDQTMQEIVSSGEPQRQATLDFVERSIDRTSPLTAEHLRAFLALPQAAQLEFARTLKTELEDDCRVLSPEEMMLSLQSPTRAVADRTLSDAAVLALALQKDILTAERLSTFNKLDDTSRAGISGMLKANVLDSESANLVFLRIESKEWTGANLRDLGVAALLGWLPEGFLKELLAEDLTLQQAVFERLSIEAPQGKPGEFSILAFMRRLQNINKWLKEGVINKPALHLLGKQHGNDLLLLNLLQTQYEKPAAERISPESVLQLIMQTRTNKISVESLETYRYGLENGYLTRDSFKTLLSQRPDQRNAAELLLRRNGEQFRELAANGRFREMTELAQSAARQVFPETFPVQGRYDCIELEDLSNALRNAISMFYEVLNSGNAASAVQRLAAQVESRELQTQLGIRMDLAWKEAEIDFHKFQDCTALEALRDTIQDQNREAIAEDSEADSVQISAIEPLVQILGQYKFRLRDAERICEDGVWRSCKQQERAFLESIQNTETAKAILTKVGLQLAQDWLSKEAEAKAKVAEEQKPIVIRELNPGNFRSVMAEGKSRQEFPNGMSAEVKINPAVFVHLEEAYALYLAGLRKASKARGRRRETAMEELVKGFEKKIPDLLEACGVKMIRSTQTPYMIPIFHIELARDYRPPGSSSKSELIDLNLQQGLRRFLTEHASGKAIYDELARIKLSGITPKYDPCPPGRKPAAINPADQRSLSSKQRSAIAATILNDFSGLYQGAYIQPEGEPVKTELEMSVLKVGAGRNNSEEAFDRAEQWHHLLYILNDFSPISAGGSTISELYDAGEFNDMHCDRDTLLMENDFIQMLLEFGILPERSLFDVHGYYRQEVDDRLKKGPAQFMEEIGLIELAESEEFMPTETFDPGEPITYNDEEYRIIARESGKVLIRYEGVAREPAPAAPRQVSDMELETRYTPVQANNMIHYLSNSANDPGIYVLSCNEKGQKLLHSDSALRFVSAELVLPRDTTQKPGRAGRELSFAPTKLAGTARKLFDTFKEYGIVIDGQGVSLAGKQETIGSGDDAGIKIADPNNQLSSRHLQLLVQGNIVSVQDLNSSNGTFLNWKRLRPYETVKLRTSDQVNLGALDGPELNLFCKPKETSTGKNHKIMVGSKTLTPDRSLTIGRLPSADVFVSNPSVSRIQATIRMNAEGKVIIKDGTAQVPSASGLVINGKQLIPGSEIELRPTDRVATRTGVELPIRFVEKSKVAMDLGTDKSMGRFAIKNSSLKEMFAGVDAQHGVYALDQRIKRKLSNAGAQLNGKHEEKPQKKDKARAYFLNKAAITATTGDGENQTQKRKINRESSGAKPILVARGSLSEAAWKQSNEHAESKAISERLEDGWCNAGKGIAIEKNGSFNLPNRIATAVNRSQDHVLRGVIEDAKRRFSSLLPEMRAAALSEYARELLTPKDLTPDQLDQWYDQFCQDHDSKRVLLGEFIKEGKGVSTQQAALLKVLADEFDDLQCKLVRGMNGNHSWTTFTFEDIEYIHDPRGRFISAIAGVDGASPKAILWIPDSETKLIPKTDLKLGSPVSFDSTSGWRVISVETQGDDIVIAASGCRLVSSADLTLANPERALLIIGEKYNIPRPDGLLDQGVYGWTLHSISRDGNLRMIKNGSIQIRVRKDQVRPRSKSE